MLLTNQKNALTNLGDITLKGKVQFKILFFVLFIFSLIFVLLISNETITIADSQKITWDPNTNFNDGIDNWKYSRVNYVGKLDISKDLRLDYTFGLAQDTNGKVIYGGDDTVIRDSTRNNQSTYYSKINTFLDDNDKYVSALFQQGWKSQMTQLESTSPSSGDFMLVPDRTSSAVSTPDYSILTNFLSGKKHYQGTDANGKPTYKFAGDFIRNNNFGHYDLRMEVVLRPSPSNAAIVQRELYVKNVSGSTQSFGILYGEDTQLNGNDAVPIYALEKNNGIYIQSSQYKLLFDRSLPDGPSNYVVSQYNSASMDWTKGFSPANFSGTGTETKNLKYGDLILGGSGGIDTSYTMKWPYTTLKPGETAHYVSSVGVSQPKYAVPKVTKTYTNKTSTDGKNHIGDKLNFDLKIMNVGYNSNWSFTKLVDQIPDGLQIDPNSLVLKNTDGTTSKLPSENYDATTKTLTIPPALTVPDGKSASIQFDTTILSNAGGTTIHNLGIFSGIDAGSDDAEERSYTATADIPIEKTAFDYVFTKQVRNVTNGETTYKDSTNAKPGDTIKFKTQFTVNPASANSLNENSFIYEVLPKGLVGEIGSAKGTSWRNWISRKN
ncbi:cell surface protein precursor [Companilactobacillus nodensis DSM 19682 = JCM 14932 = NBRC 107160]|uniref:Cell surface protein n=1 Tax=Companilactobacillus nodensis DSM 19682 = JCM 14932 = NBRC 107160 TaxID=1423775 RepID=A0A0R1K837_9LACO|nr:cell surface protein precursor [Companilactobacillus nodensis DSM 19682 = JCM 14932 = NBRC 107160]